jgi:tetratricopeptide (TPR) repeat protein
LTSDAYHRAHRLAEVGRLADAERTARDALAATPADGHLLTLLASVLRLQRKYAAALSTAEAAVSASPSLADAHAERAECLLLLIRSRDAVAAAEEAVRLAPDRPDGHLVLARALAATRAYPRARAAAAHGLALAPGSVPALLTVADVERDAGNREAAARAARAALAVAPDHAYGRWLIAMLDAERLRVRRSMRGLRDVARQNPARPDLMSLTWPVRGVLSGLRRGLTAGAIVVCLLVVAGRWWDPAGLFGRVLAAVLAVVLAGFAARVLLPAGRLPWRCLRLLPPLMRRANVAALITVTLATALLVAHAATGWWVFAVLALVAAPVMWSCSLLEMVGAGLDDPGFRHAFRDLASEFREWWQTTKRDLRAARHDDPEDLRQEPPR